VVTNQPTAWAALLSHSAPSVGAARRQLANDLHRYGVEGQQCDDAVLVLSELVSNALKHARPLSSGGIRVAWRYDGGDVRLAVTDGGSSTRPVANTPPLSSLGGRGLAIVGSLAQSWGVDDDDLGTTTVWAILTLDAQRRSNHQQSRQRGQSRRNATQVES
jgi:anti-sigma regulatory factor (Ser/Thr protein kinase)